jgi:hypothetical protein
LLGTGDELFRVEQGDKAQIVSRPNLVVVTIDNLDKQSIERRKRGKMAKSSNFVALVAAGVLVIVAP